MFWDEQKYLPTPEDVEWMANVLRLLKDAGTLIFPSTKLKYRVDHQEHELTLVNPDVLQEDDLARITHLRTIEVARVVGYKVRLEA